ncbi:MAG: hypothetical protein HQL76_07375 [Magnetococcales bacterium]|nr:hypothetical protein [Magnetococcales bacterium]
MGTVNCWEVKRCGFDKAGPGDTVCPAVTWEEADGFLGGRNGGRACFFIPGTFCGKDGPCSTRDKAEICVQCRFFHDLKENYGAAFNAANFRRFVKNSAARTFV